jgi:threonine synthase
MPPDMRPNQDSIAVSIAATRGTFQAHDIVRRSEGAAVTIGNDDLLRWQRALASEEGIYLETSSAAAIAAAAELRRQGRIGASDTVVALLTASGLKDAPMGAGADPLIVPGNMTQALQVLRSGDIFPAP